MSGAVGWLPDDAETLFGADARAEEAYGLLTVDVPADRWITALETARDRLGCTFFDWLSAVDESGAGLRVCAHVVALPPYGGERTALRRLVLRCTVSGERPELPTATDVFAGASWHERETHEMFGVYFTGHPRLSPLLLPEAFEGHPLRKDFVLAARVAKAWPGAKEPGESGHGGPKRRRMLPPGVPDPNEWGPLKGQLPPVPARPARGRRASAGSAEGSERSERPERPARRTRSAGGGSASQRASRDGTDGPGGPEEPDEAAPGSVRREAPWHSAEPAEPAEPAGPAEAAEPTEPTAPATGPEDAEQPDPSEQPRQPARRDERDEPERPE